MFETLKNSPKLAKLWQTQNKIKKETEKISVFHQEGDNSVAIRGDKKLEKFVLNGVERKDLKDFINEAMKKLDKKLEKEMKGNTGDILELLK